MAGTITFSIDNGQGSNPPGGRVRTVTGTWISDAAAGTVPSTVITDSKGSNARMCGRLVKAITVSGSPTPTNGYSIVITDGNGANILANSQQNLTSIANNSVVERYFMILDTLGTPQAHDSPVVFDVLSVSLSGCGNSKQGSFTLYFEG